MGTPGTGTRTCFPVDLEQVADSDFRARRAPPPPPPGTWEQSPAPAGRAISEGGGVGGGRRSQLELQPSATTPPPPATSCRRRRQRRWFRGIVVLHSSSFLSFRRASFSVLIRLRSSSLHTPPEFLPDTSMGHNGETVISSQSPNLQLS